MINKQKVYLAGGFKSGWANEVKNTSDKFSWINPNEKEFKKGERLGWLPMDAIKDIVLTTDMLTGKMVKLPDCKCGKCSMCKNVKLIE